MSERSDGALSLGGYLGALRRNWILLLAFMAICVAAAIAYSLIKEPTYTARATVRFLSPSAPTALQTQANAASITNPQALSLTSEMLDEPLSTDRLQAAISTSIGGGSGLVEVEASSGNGATAAEIANAVAGAAVEVVNDTARERAAKLEARFEERLADAPKSVSEEFARRLAQLSEQASTGSVDAEVVEEATAPSSPTTPKPLQNAVLGLGLGFVIGALVALLRDAPRRRRPDSAELESRLGLPVVAQVQASALADVTDPSGNHDALDFALEPFRIMRSNLDFLGADKPINLIGISSPVASECGSMVATGLAIAGAIAGKRVLIVDSCLRQPAQAARLQMTDAPGLSDYLLGDGSAADVVQTIAFDGDSGADGPAGAESSTAPGVEAGEDDSSAKAAAGGEANASAGGDARSGGGAAQVALSVLEGTRLDGIPAGTPAPNPAELLSSRRFDELLAGMRSDYDLVVLDCGPLLPVADAREIVPHMDAVLLCLEPGPTTLAEAAEATAVLEQRLPGRPAGLVICDR